MKGILAVLLTLAVAPAVAEDWRRYDNAAFGYAIELPVPFEIVEENEARLVLRDGPRTLEVFGLDLAPLDFEEAVNLAIGSSEDEGYAVTGRAVTSRWAQWMGINGEWQLAAVLVPLCGSALAGYELRFTEADGVAMQPVIDRLTSSLRRTRDC